VKQRFSTNSMEQNPNSEADSCSARLYQVHNSPPLVSEPGISSPSLRPYFFKIHFNIIIIYTSVFQEISPLYFSPPKFCQHFCLRPACHMSPSSFSLPLITFLHSEGDIDSHFYPHMEAQRLLRAHSSPPLHFMILAVVVTRFINIRFNP